MFCNTECLIDKLYSITAFYFVGGWKKARARCSRQRGGKRYLVFKIQTVSTYLNLIPGISDFMYFFYCLCAKRCNGWYMKRSITKCAVFSYTVLGTFLNFFENPYPNCYSDQGLQVRIYPFIGPIYNGIKGAYS